MTEPSKHYAPICPLCGRKYKLIDGEWVKQECKQHDEP